MTLQKPYLIRAIYQWLLDNQTTPYVLVNTRYDGVVVPKEYVKDHRIVLNLAPDAIQDLQLDNEWISFSARFSGKSMDLFIPVNAVQAIYGKENNEGMFFPDEDSPPPEPANPALTVTQSGRPSLKIVK